MRGRGLICAVMCGTAILVGCGGDDDKPAGSDLTAIRCPLAPTGDEAGGSAQYEPAENAFDTAELIGLSLDDARSKAAEHKCEVVVSYKDGRGVPVPIDVDPKRIYVYTEDGVVTQIEGVGGGI
jgi:hypothetical protein